MNGLVEIGDVSPRRYFAVLAVVLGLLFAMVGGDDESAAAVLRSIVQWQLQSCVPMAMLLLAHVMCARLSAFDKLGAWLKLVVSGVAGAALFAPAALALDVYVFAEVGEKFSLSEVLDEFLNIAPPITLSWLAMNAPFVLGFRLRARDDQPSAKAVESPKVGPVSGFRSMIPAADHSPVILLQAELHYLAVVTEQGRSLVLYNLRDAVAELESVEGFQTHRSFWVNLAYVEKFRREGRQGLLIMKNGDQVPVSRRRIAELKKALR